MLIPNNRALSTKLFQLILHYSMSLDLGTVLVDKLRVMGFFSVDDEQMYDYIN